MKRTVDYSKSPSPKFDAVEDIKRELGPRWDSASPLMSKVTNPEDFQNWAGFAGIEGFPVMAWYELYHGDGSWAKAWDWLQRQRWESVAKRPTSVISTITEQTK